eukprot:c12495_g1_i1.p1 GENE.c12495_g1_i1~~c12495_g1_i1.p1  ORF type:complete len:120 (+),score=30.56 c12495_g1_i1:424-783(+)
MPTLAKLKRSGAHEVVVVIAFLAGFIGLIIVWSEVRADELSIQVLIGLLLGLHTVLFIAQLNYIVGLFIASYLGCVVMRRALATGPSNLRTGYILVTIGLWLVVVCLIWKAHSSARGSR